MQKKLPSNVRLGKYSRCSNHCDYSSCSLIIVGSPLVGQYRTRVSWFTYDTSWPFVTPPSNIPKIPKTLMDAQCFQHISVILSGFTLDTAQHSAKTFCPFSMRINVGFIGWI